MNNEYPEIVVDFDLGPEKQNDFYVRAIERILGHILPPNFFQEPDVVDKLEDKLPLMSWTRLLEPPFDLSFFLCSRFRPNAFRFFYEMVSRWLIPGKRMNALVQFAIDFSLPHLSKQKYIGGEVMIRIDNMKELEILRKNLPIIESEIRSGAESYYQSCRILEIKGLSADEKTALIQENIASMIKYRPQDFDYDILSEMQHFLVLCKDSFKAARDFRHMNRIICVHYLFRKALKHSLEAFPNRRYINIKLVRGMLQKKKRVLGIALGISFIRDNEIIDARHILSGIRAIIPDAEMENDSFFRNQSRSDSTCTIYLEITKAGGKNIGLDEERLLKEGLPMEIDRRIEKRVNTVFMPQNEEEIMRDMLSLSEELKFVKDLPQAIITFSHQTEEQLEFLVVMLRVLKPGLPSIASYFQEKPTILEFIPDRIKTIGILRRKYKKQASVFRLRLPKLPFLREDHAIDLYKARQEVAAELERVIGTFRDYNGGILSRENQLFEELRKELGKQGKEHAFFLENFFYSLSPPVMRSVLPAEPIKILFLKILDSGREGLPPEQHYNIYVQEESQYFYLVLMARDLSFRKKLLSGLEKLDMGHLQMATCDAYHIKFRFFGLILRGAPLKERQLLKGMVEQVMEDWVKAQFFEVAAV